MKMQASIALLSVIMCNSDESGIHNKSELNPKQSKKKKNPLHSPLKTRETSGVKVRFEEESRRSVKGD